LVLDASGIAPVSKEGVMDSNHPARKLASGVKWAQKATKRRKAKGTEGSLTRIAKEHSESPMGFAQKHLHDTAHPKWEKKSQFAVNVNKRK
jgi:hypothetical protein